MNKKVIDLLLVLALLAAIGFLVFSQLQNVGGLQSSISTATNVPNFASTQTDTIVPTRTALPTRTSTSTPKPTATRRPTSTPTTVPTATVTIGPTQSPVDGEIQDGIERGSRIVEAIEAYNQAQGFYPPALRDLVPNYLPEIPVTVTGQPFFYRVFERTTVMSPEIYWVSFKVASQEHVTCTYFRRLQYWDCNFVSP